MPIYLRVCRIVILMDPPLHCDSTFRQSIDSAYADYFVYLVYIREGILPASTYFAYLRHTHVAETPEKLRFEAIGDAAYFYKCI